MSSTQDINQIKPLSSPRCPTVPQTQTRPNELCIKRWLLFFFFFCGVFFVVGFNIQVLRPGFGQLGRDPFAFIRIVVARGSPPL